MPDFNPFDMDFDGDVDGIDFLGFDYLMRRVLRPNRDEAADDELDDGDDPEDDNEDSEIDEDDY